MIIYSFTILSINNNNKCILIFKYLLRLCPINTFSPYSTWFLK